MLNLGQRRKTKNICFELAVCITSERQSRNAKAVTYQSGEMCGGSDD